MHARFINHLQNDTNFSAKCIIEVIVYFIHIHILCVINVYINVCKWLCGCLGWAVVKLLTVDWLALVQKSTILLS